MSRQRPPLQPPPPPAAPARRAKVVINEQRIDLDQLRRIDPQDGDVLVLPGDFPREDFRALAEALELAKPGLKCLIVRGDVRLLSVADMNRLGWYRA
ncbi:TPA: hypothetical protein N0H38_004442 [Pseudomonas aeruginosa]|nr:hypothetical protein [Pseudomonas aeruginosa]HCK4574119.1 hypothetical protein [Pseudomonas aeruginosa]HCK4790562.1 hypothetical protein [Pseudomonas aeruginosa]HCK4799626.1 hypothetical protein [Pseudomonas aeruginosa]HCK5645978.1 hypothetical protein [Pseudomonas aeruginosa]